MTEAWGGVHPKPITAATRLPEQQLALPLGGCHNPPPARCHPPWTSSSQDECPPWPMQATHPPTHPPTLREVVLHGQLNVGVEVKRRPRAVGQQEGGAHHSVLLAGDGERDQLLEEADGVLPQPAGVVVDAALPAGGTQGRWVGGCRGGRVEGGGGAPQAGASGCKWEARAALDREWMLPLPAALDRDWGGRRGGRVWGQVGRATAAAGRLNRGTCLESMWPRGLLPPTPPATLPAAPLLPCICCGATTTSGSSTELGQARVTTCSTVGVGVGERGWGRVRGEW